MTSYLPPVYLLSRTSTIHNYRESEEPRTFYAVIGVFIDRELAQEASYPEHWVYSTPLPDKLPTWTNMVRDDAAVTTTWTIQELPFYTSSSDPPQNRRSS